MAEELLIRRRKPKEAGPVVVEPPTEDQQTMLGALGGAAMSGLHRIGSVISAPSRLIHGTINAGLDKALGTDTGGFGNLNPIDSTGGIEGSKHLERMGLLAPNDPTKWEWRDPLAGAADIALDPLSYAFGVGLAKRGASALSKATGLTDYVLKPAVSAAKKSFPVRAWRGNMSASVQGVMDPVLQDLMVPNYNIKRHARNKAAELATRWGMEQKAAGFSDKLLRQVLEDVVDPSTISNSTHRTVLTRMKKEHDAIRDDIFNSMNKRGTGYSSRLADVTPSGMNLGWAGRRRSRGAGGVAEAFATSGINDSKLRKYIFKGVEGGTARLNEILHEAATAAKGMSDYRKVAAHLEANYGKEIAKTFKNSKGRDVNRYKALGRYILKNKDFLSGAVTDASGNVRPNYLFGNSPIDDMAGSYQRALIRKTNADTLGEALAKFVSAPPATPPKPQEATTVRALLAGLKYRPHNKGGAGFVEHVASRHAPEILARTGIDISSPKNMDALLDMVVTPKQATELKLLSPRFSAPAAMDETTNVFRRGMSGWKAYTLAFPASRMRDAASGGAQNVLRFGMSGALGYGDAARVLRGDLVKNDYRHVPEVQRFLTRTGINPSTATKAQQTDAIRQIVAVHAPTEHGIIADLPTAQVGSQLDDVIHNVPGQTKTTTFNQLIGDPIRALLGKDGATWMKPVSGVRGFSATPLKHSTMAPIRSSEIFSGNMDRLNRTAPLLEMLRRGNIPGQTLTDATGATRRATAHEIADAVNRAQVDYTPDSYSAFEKGIKSYLAPFYAFQSRMIPETAMQLANPSSNTAKLARIVDKVGTSNPAVPDYVNESYAVPMGRTDDGSLRYLTGLGLMHEPATQVIGDALNANARKLGYTAMKSLNPLIGKPAEAITGQSFWRDGQPVSELESSTGRFLANVGQLTGLRPAPEDPMAYNTTVKYPGRAAVDFLLGMTPGDRVLKTLNQLTDVRRGPGEVAMHAMDPNRTMVDNAASLASGLAPVVSGVRVTDISPRRQMQTLKKRAEEMAVEQGAHELKRVLFTNSEIEKLLNSDDPSERALGERQQAIQNYVNSLSGTGPAKGVIRRKKRSMIEQ